MPVNFFDAVCQTPTNAILFGICDTQPPPQSPAYISTTHTGDWIAIVDNPNSVDVIFTAIDNCIVILKANGVDKDSSCDCMLTYQNTIIFIELKERQSQGWLVKADNQIRNTILHFTANNNMAAFSSKTAYIANSLRPNMASSEMTRKQKFKDDTDFFLKIQNTISI